MRQFSILFAIAVLLPAWSQDLVLTPERDNTLYQNAAGSLSNGQGPNLFAGQTAQGSNRRALLAFDLSGIAPGTQIGNATLELDLNLEPPSAGPTPVAVHRLTADWGEATSNTGQAPGGLGAAAQPGDATWLHAFFNTTTWTSAGGDFVSAPSAVSTVDNPGLFQWSGPAFTSDVQSWVDNPAGNFGLVLVGDETDSRNARRFSSREGETAPRLLIDFAPVPEPGTMGLFGLGFLMLFLLKRKSLQKES